MFVKRIKCFIIIAKITNILLMSVQYWILCMCLQRTDLEYYRSFIVI